ncbi:Ig-like domain-containing protein [Mumia zhuanghuii]|uniref:Tandem-95 repeat protein n=1 Tax=Mumia zhuanghuii TaxID=2585211 RepID=A0A5C4MMC0_9ACTN|nr:Ig-like domain-containing protein [Mumia zhuanghuii]TNC41803.1 tandem-95 repeat protein [Mumia zhuanghuii]TNC43181.1 tandem-95 repeat protein [Mumia zhuanghuii]
MARGRRVLGSLTAGALVAGTLSAFGLASASPALAATNLAKNYNYKCNVDAAGLPLGVKDVGVHAAVEVPDSVVAGETIPARKTQITLTMPEDLRGATVGLLGAKTAGGKSTDASITVTAPGVSDPLVVPIGNLSAPQTDVPTEAGAIWKIPTEGDVPEITVPAGATEAATLRMPANFNIAATLVRHDGGFVGSEGAVKLACELDAAGPNGDGLFGAIPIVEPVNQLPVAKDVTASTGAGDPVAVTLDASDPEGANLTYTTTPPSHGTLSGDAPNLTYTPADGFVGTDSFTYTVSDGAGEATATVTVKVAGGEGSVTTEDVTVSEPLHRGFYVPTIKIALAGSGGEGSLTYKVGTISGPNNGRNIWPTVSGNEVVLQVSEGAALGDYRFDYTATDAAGQSSTSTVRFTIANIAPVVEDRTFTTTKDKPFDGWPWARDRDTGGPFVWNEPSTRFTYGKPGHGTIKPFFTADDNPASPDSQFAAVKHKYTYVPDPGFVGTDSFTVTMTDKDGASATGKVTINVVEPPEAAAGVLNDVRFRCAYAIRVDETGMPTADPDAPIDPGMSEIVSTVMGGDATFRVDLKAHMPELLQPGEKFTVPDTDITLKMAQPMAELLAGADFSTAPAGSLPPLEESGFGQTSVAGQANATAVFTETATGETYEVPMSDLKSADVPMSLPVPAAGVSIPVKGGLPELTAPMAGALQVATPKKMFINSVLTPGVLGGLITDVGLDCTAMDGEELTIGTVEVDDPPTADDVAASTAIDKAVTVALKGHEPDGQKLTYSVGTAANGTVTTDGAKATYTPKAGFAGTDSFTYTVSDGTHEASAKVTVTVEKAAASVKASAPSSRYGASPRVAVTVSPTKAGGRVEVLKGSKVLGQATVAGGRASVALPRTALKPGKHTLTVRYLGDAKTKPSSTSVRLTVLKAKASVAAKVTTKKVVAGKTRAKVRVTVKASGTTPTGKVAVYYRGKKVGTATLSKNGTAVVRLKKLAKSGKVTLKVRYLGSATTSSAAKTLKVKVKRR